MAINTCFDAIMFGHLTFTPFNYVNLNLINKYADTFGVTPMYQYLIFTIRECLPHLGVLVIISFTYFWFKFPKHILTWLTLPFFIAHSLIGHKEFRFLFPIAPFLPLILFFLINQFNWINSRRFKLLFLIFNVPLLIYFCFTPAASTNRYFKHLYDKNIPVTEVNVFEKHFEEAKFYLKNDIHYKIIDRAHIPMVAKNSPNVFFLTKNLADLDLILKENNCRVDFSLYPAWIYQFDFIKRRRTFRSWSFVECVN
jgi:phosphatidylinositol glycan class B